MQDRQSWMFADRVAFIETLQQYKEDFSLLLQHMADYYKALLADESSCVSASIAIIHLFSWRKSLRIFMHYVTILIQLPYWRVTRYCVILEKGCTMEGIAQLRTLISYVLLVVLINQPYLSWRCYMANTYNTYIYIQIRMKQKCKSNCNRGIYYDRERCGNNFNV